MLLTTIIAMLAIVCIVLITVNKKEKYLLLGEMGNRAYVPADDDIGANGKSIYSIPPNNLSLTPLNSTGWKLYTENKYENQHWVRTHPNY